MRQLLIFGAVLQCLSSLTSPAHACEAALKEALRESDDTTVQTLSIPLSAAVTKYECARCHQVEGIPHPGLTKNCIRCHRQILNGDMDGVYSPLRTSGWKKNIEHFMFAPPLINLSNRLRRDWVEQFLQSPHLIRPQLGIQMPRLKIDAAAATAIADYFYGHPDIPGGDEPPELKLAAAIPGDKTAGEKIYQDRGCMTCHKFAAALLPYSGYKNLDPPLRLAPDLRRTKKRMTPDQIRAWLCDPQAILVGAMMPDPNLTPEEISHVTEYILSLPDPQPLKIELPKLNLLARQVSYDEVETRVLKKVCWHCHSDPTPVMGDGGPGNSGGFGFAGAGLDLGSYESLMRGSRRPDGSSVSVLAKEANGTPKIINHLLSRHLEVNNERGIGSGPFDSNTQLGMPLGMPPLPFEDIELLLTWIEQGAKSGR